jgi:hypothetical protein
MGPHNSTTVNYDKRERKNAVELDKNAAKADLEKLLSIFYYIAPLLSSI